MHISAIRRAFGRDALATIPGRGYQWMLPEEETSTVLAHVASYGDTRSEALETLVSLPTPSVRLIGRDSDIDQIMVLLDEARWVVILGAVTSEKQVSHVPLQRCDRVSQSCGSI